jgi:hypothetical protein
MSGNPAETAESEISTKIGISDDFTWKKLDRRVSVAPMLEWTDEVNLTNKIINLGSAKKARTLYDSSICIRRDWVIASFVRAAGGE